ncbi:MAG: hypothetical protein ACRCTS_06515 [Fusobacteriaceae bacterium]
MNEKILKRKKRNRKTLFYTLVFLGVTFFTHSYYLKIVEARESKKDIINSEIFSVNNSFLSREEFFYSDEEYLKKHTFLKKEWESEYEGVKFYGKSESKEQKYNLASTYETPKSPTAN